MADFNCKIRKTSTFLLIIYFISFAFCDDAVNVKDAEDSSSNKTEFNKGEHKQPRRDSHVDNVDQGSTHGDLEVENTDDPKKAFEESNYIVNKAHVSPEGKVITEVVSEDIDVNEVSDILQTEETSKPKLDTESVLNSNNSIVQWFRYLFDPILEEFKEGIFQNVTNKVNLTAKSEAASEINVVTVNSTSEILNTTMETSLNTTVESDKNNSTTDTAKKSKFQCTGRSAIENSNATVQLISTARLTQILNLEKNATDNVTDCLLVMFYAPWCHFCAKTAPHYNALARAFPQLDFLAVDTAQFSNLLAKFGTVSVPNILVFHQSRMAVKFNETERIFEKFVSFVTNATGLQPNTSVQVTEADYQGPVPSIPTNEPDYLLLLSWLFVICCSSYMVVKSNKGQQWINKVRILWQEHQHID
ncbi:uncharacterized protein LOC127868762 [Dreissena polymorpha]|uniref:Thioredoxin domain-containing protein n=1 Tax=Dreissena polymorpha TaxID=45954 RepID=A0A9D4M9X2_DREPO|nr:uncharacterized protein LOC127868762 [Dreissena polymorpha]KAH3872419.1 hypothetical protein DPMN_035635 [Dreissena polymorpha]